MLPRDIWRITDETCERDRKMALLPEHILEDLGVKQPSGLLKVKYGNMDVQPGTELTPTLVKDTPCCEWNDEPGQLYTIVMNDPDAPSRENPKFREWHHWCVTNIPGCDINQGTLLTEYVGAGPPKGSGLHRYVFLVYRQAGKINFNEPRLHRFSGDGRKSYSVASFAKKYKFGTPVAGNFFEAQWDDYVPLLYKQLSGK
ncbi:hypothetical protein LSH36_274g00036 [Paralvinella palmiformis]|uniref:Uncharacterized protein n=1 Tax=Paralvinella palmiformis TaxID=53620 RepID=A0AAD9N4P9_9ANNE|nr:hypothetical protein LSH36_274g00036 [Paralvinella palmiformis]